METVRESTRYLLGTVGEVSSEEGEDGTMTLEMKIIEGLKSDFEIALNTLLGDGWLNETSSFRVTVNTDENFIYHTIVFRQIP